jgi:excisionase family DNA binding protein
VISLEDGSVLLSVQEAARVLGVSQRSVYGYLTRGKLSRTRIEGLMMLPEAEVLAFERGAPGRPREEAPFWHLPPQKNPLSITTITVQALPDCDGQLEGRLAEFRAESKHCLAGTSARYIGRNRENPAEVVIVLLWRGAVLPAQEQRETALAALRADLANLCAWDTAAMEEGLVVLYAE